LDQFKPEQVLETRLFETFSQAEQPSTQDQDSSFLDALASGDPTPGGGSASAYSAAMAAALVAMVGRVTVGKKKYAQVEAEMGSLIEEASELQQAMKEAVDKDAQAFSAYMQARKLPKDTEQEKNTRSQALYAASITAAEVPLDVAQNALKIIQLALKASALGNVNAISDAGAAVSFAKAALDGAGLNVRINLLGMEKEPEPSRMLDQLKSLERDAKGLILSLQRVLDERGGLSLS
jgi:glutamate formiminotransferase / formiminotetrahydrofolate cyclodeaminase